MLETKKTPEKKEQSFSGNLKSNNKESIGINKETVTITFRENRKFDLHIGREIKVFRGRESKPIPSSWLNHKDWVSAKKYFIVKGV